jgi:BNR repeat-like domain
LKPRTPREADAVADEIPIRPKKATMNRKGDSRRGSPVLCLGLAAVLAATIAGGPACAKKAAPPPVSRGYTIPLIDLAADTSRQVVVDREPGQYLGHPTTVLLEDGKTMIAVYPKGHGRGPIIMKRSADGGLTWGERLPVPENWATSLETPTIHRVVGPDGKKRLLVWSGLYPARLSVSEDDGASWTPLAPAGDWGGIVVMSALVELEPFGRGRYMAMFHDDGRFFTKEPHQESPVAFTLYKTLSKDGGLTWSSPEAVYKASEVQLCEPGIIRSPDGKTLAALLRENSRRRNSFVIFSTDEGKTWTAPRELPGSLTGDRHTGKYAPDGRFLISFRDMTHESPTRGDWVAWVGTFDDIVKGREGQYRVRLMDNTKDADCAYPGVELLPDGTFVATTYGHWTAGAEPYIMSVRLRLDELDRLAR